MFKNIIKKTKNILEIIAIIGLILIIKIPMIGCAILFIALIFYPFFMLLSKEDPKQDDIKKDI